VAEIPVNKKDRRRRKKKISYKNNEITFDLYHQFDMATKKEARRRTQVKRNKGLSKAQIKAGQRLDAMWNNRTVRRGRWKYNMVIPFCSENVPQSTWEEFVQAHLDDDGRKGARCSMVLKEFRMMVNGQNEGLGKGKARQHGSGDSGRIFYPR
jgi:hypothetical protein